MKMYVIVLSLLMSVAAFGAGERQRVRLEYRGEHLRGQNTLYLKRKLMDQTGMRANQFDLMKVVLIAKSKHGGGRATLSVGGTQSYSETVGGYPRDFHVNRPATYMRTRFQNPAYNSQGAWQIKLKGNFKIKAVVLVVKRKGWNNGGGNHGGRLNFTNIAQMKANKVIGSRKSFSINRRVRGIKLRVQKNTVEIVSARVYFSDGGSRELHSLTGRLRNGGTMVARFSAQGGRRVSRVEVEAVTTGLFGSRGRVFVDIAR